MEIVLCIKLGVKLILTVYQLLSFKLKNDVKNAKPIAITAQLLDFEKSPKVS